MSIKILLKRRTGRSFEEKLHVFYTVRFIGPTEPADKSYRVNRPLQELKKIPEYLTQTFTGTEWIADYAMQEGKQRK